MSLSRCGLPRIVSKYCGKYGSLRADELRKFKELGKRFSHNIFC